MGREKESLIDTMTEETEELQTRIDKLNRDKESLSLELAKALAQVDVAASEAKRATAQGSVFSTDKNLADVANQLRIVKSERESLKDEVTKLDGQNVLLRSELSTIRHKLEISDMEPDAHAGERCSEQSTCGSAARVRHTETCGETASQTQLAGNTPASAFPSAHCLVVKRASAELADRCGQVLGQDGVSLAEISGLCRVADGARTSSWTTRKQSFCFQVYGLCTKVFLCSSKLIVTNQSAGWIFRRRVLVLAEHPRFEQKP